MFSTTKLLYTLCLLLLFWILMFAPAIYSKIKHRSTYESPSIVGSSVFLLYMIMIPIVAYTDGKMYKTFEIYFDVFSVIIVYAVLLILFNKIIRKHCSAGLCASLWGLIGLLFFFGQRALTDETLLCSATLVMVPVPRNILITIGAIWTAGFILYIGSALYRHFKFCKYISKGAEPIESKLYDELSNTLKCNRGCDLFKSPNASTPITVGIWDLKLYLPNCEYSDEELKWIFKHEITHIKNGDNITKLLMTFVNGMAWFLPFVWRSNTLAAEDIELNCDEKILSGASEEERNFYASLILNVGSECKGFNTCLSASGECIRYRLSKIIHPQENKLIKDILVSGLALIILLMWPGIVRFSSDYGTLEDFEKIGPKYKIEVETNTTIDETKLLDFINSQRIYAVENDPLDESATKQLTLETNEDVYEMEFGNHKVNVVHLIKDEDGNGYETFYVEAFYIPNNDWKEIFKAKNKA